MKQKMQTFNDGICTICETDEEGKLIAKFKGVRFGNRIIGSQRFFAAAQAQTEIHAMIRVLKNLRITPHDTVVIKRVENGKQVTLQYNIEQVQHLDDKMPPVTDLTLRQLECGNFDTDR